MHELIPEDQLTSNGLQVVEAQQPSSILDGVHVVLPFDVYVQMHLGELSVSTGELGSESELEGVRQSFQKHSFQLASGVPAAGHEVLGFVIGGEEFASDELHGQSIVRDVLLLHWHAGLRHLRLALGLGRDDPLVLNHQVLRNDLGQFELKAFNVFLFLCDGFDIVH